MAFPAAVFADQLSQEWQSQRDYFNEMTDRVCEGDVGALEELNNAAWQLENGVALHNIAWIYSNQATCPTAAMGMPYDADAAIDAQTISAFTNYPVGQYGYGMMLIEGRYGSEPRPGNAEGWLQNSREGGFARGAEQLALIYAQGLHNCPKDAGYARQLVAEAEALGLPASRLETLRDDVAYYLSSDTPSQAAVETSQAPQAPQQPTTQTTTGAGAVVQVIVERGAKRLGDTTNAGNWNDVVVYVAQGFQWEGSCWSSENLFMTGRMRTNIHPDAARSLQIMLESSDTMRQAGENGANVQNFRSLDEGVNFIKDNPWFVNEIGENLRWSLAQVEGMGPRCPNDLDIVYPVPVRDEGF